MTDAYLTGLRHTLQALAYVAGAGTPLVIGAALVLIALFAWRRTRVTRTSYRLRREARRSGRTTHRAAPIRTHTHSECTNEVRCVDSNCPCACHPGN